MSELCEKIFNYLQKINKKTSNYALRKKLEISGEKEIDLFEKALALLIEEGKIYVDKNGEYQVFDYGKLNKVQGRLYVSKKGNGYVTVDMGEKGKFTYLIHLENLNGALTDDIVVLSDLKHMKSDYILAHVEKIVKRNHTEVVFEYQGNGVFIPYNQKSKLTFLIDENEYDNYVYGDRVLVEIGGLKIGKILDTPVFEGRVKCLIGHKDDPKIDIETIAYDYGFTTKFSEKSLKELEKIPTGVTEDELKGRCDYRDKTIFTIDGADTKDIDDAISITKEDGIYTLGVHIANVSHYVKPGMALFEDAKERATSAYLLDYVIPMLPHKLSNGICSLNPGVDRLTVSVIIKIDSDGHVIDYEINESVINSKIKMTYECVNDILENGIIHEGYESFVNDLILMKELSKKLEENKLKRGSIDFASSEIKIKTDDEGNAINLEKRIQRQGEKIIENFMLLANEIVALYHYNMNVPFVYRIHESPNLDKFIETLEFLYSQNLIDKCLKERLLCKINNNSLQSYDINNLLKVLKEKPYFSLVSNLLLKSMSRAVYSPSNEGHYGLALKNYTHFTSPIRRFPDLMVHTLLDEYKTFERLDEIESSLKEICEHSSFMERRADDAEKEANELKMAEYMMDYIGEVFEGTVISCNRYGMIVMLDNMVKGKVDYDDILDGGYYYYGEQSKQLINKADHSKNYKMGDSVYIKVKSVSIPHRLINFYASKENVFEEGKKLRKRVCIK